MVTSLRTRQAIFASNALLIAEQGIASCSQILHLREIIPTAREKRACLVAISICCGAFSVAIMCTTIGCSPSNTMNTGSQASCHHGVCTSYTKGSGAKLIMYTGSAVGHRGDLDYSPDSDTRHSPSISIQGATNTR